MPRVAAILRFSAVLLLCCGYLPGASAQTSEPPVARKFDEFGPVGHCDLTARLDNLAVSLQNSPGAVAHIMLYSPPGPGEMFLGHMKNYLVMTRGVLPKRIKTIYAGRNSDLKLPKIELWIVPRNAPPPEPQKYETNIETFKGLLADELGYDDLGIQYEDQMGPGIGNTTDAAFADILNEQKNAVGYVVVYSGEDATPGAWQTIAQNELDYLKKFKLEPGRVKVIFGGHQKETRLQLWILPKEEPPPVRDAGPELPPAKTVKAGDFYATNLGTAQNETNLFKRLKEILVTQKSVRVFLVVNLEIPTPETIELANEPEPEELDEPSQPLEEHEPADLIKLVEKWRGELAETHKIGADRFIVLYATAREYDSDHIKLWIVPQGQPLPDPNEEEPEPENPDPQKR